MQFFFKALCVTSNHRANVVTFSRDLHVHLKIYQIRSLYGCVKVDEINLLGPLFFYFFVQVLIKLFNDTIREILK